MSTDGTPVDVLRYETDDGPVYRTIEAGDGEAVVRAHEDELRKRRLVRRVFLGLFALAGVGYGLLTDSLLVGILVAATVIVVAVVTDGYSEDEHVPDVVEQNMYEHDAEQQYDIENE